MIRHASFTRRAFAQPLSTLRLNVSHLPCPSPPVLVPIRSFHLSTIPYPRSSLSCRHSSSSSGRCPSCSPLLPSLSRRFPSLSSPLSPSHRHFSGGGHDSHALTSDFLPREEVEARVLIVLRGIEKLSSASITPSSSFDDLGLDSLDQVEVVMQLEEEFCVDLYDPDAAKITTVPQAVEIFSNFPFAQ